MNDLEHLLLSKEECEKLIRVLGWVLDACQHTGEEEAFLRNVQYKLRSRIKSEM